MKSAVTFFGPIASAASAATAALSMPPETAAARAGGEHHVGTLVGDERVAVALASDERGIDVGDKQLLLEVRRARHHRAVGSDDLAPAPERDAVLVRDAVREDDVQREVLRVEPVHEPA